MAEILDRERQAHEEIAATRVSRGGAWTLVGFLLVLIVVGPALELLRFAQGRGSVFAGEPRIPGVARLMSVLRESGPFAANAELKDGLLALEDRMGRESELSARLRPYAQWALWRGLGYGNAQVIAASDGFLYFQTAFRHQTGRPFLAPTELERRRRALAPGTASEPDPVVGLVALRDTLRDRGIDLVFVPVPLKSEIHPEPLLGGQSLSGEMPRNPSMTELLDRLTAAGVAHYDPAPDLRAAALDGEIVYLPTDTHWNPAGLRIAARGLAETLRSRGFVSPTLPLGLERHAAPRRFQGELVAMLGLGDLARRVPPEDVTLDEVSALGGGALATVPLAPEVLVLGDSYTAIFSEPGERGSAGFADQLAFELDRPVRRMARVAANDLPRRVLWLRDDPELLAGIRVVVYEVTARALSTTDWTPTPIDKPRLRRRSPH